MTARAKASKLLCSIGQAEYGERWGEGAARELDCILRRVARGFLEDAAMELSCSSPWKTKELCWLGSGDSLKTACNGVTCEMGFSDCFGLQSASDPLPTNLHKASEPKRTGNPQSATE